MEQKLFIRIIDGQPFEHPIIEQNFVDVFSEEDINNLSENFAEFIRVERPQCGIFEVVEGPVYQWENGKIKDVWTIRPMTEQERQEKIQQAKDGKPFPSWTLNEETLEFIFPVPFPNDGKSYKWDENVLNWVDVSIGE